MSDEPRQYTRDEMREMLLKGMAGIAVYWANVEAKDGPKTTLDRINGAMFSVLNIFDGNTLTSPGFLIVPHGDPSDIEYHKENEENWWPVVEDHEHDIGGALHEQWHKHERKA